MGPFVIKVLAMSKVYFLCEWIEEAERLHDNFYKYDKVDHLGEDNEEVKIICPLHGEFITTYGEHINTENKSICPECEKEIVICNAHENDPIIKYKENIFNLDFKKHIKNNMLNKVYSDSHYFVYAFTDGYKSPEKIKIGVSKDPHKRLKEIQAATPFPVFLLEVFDCKTQDNAFKVESMVHKFFNKQSCDFFGFDGATEWMYYTNKILIYIKTIMKENGLS